MFAGAGIHDVLLFDVDVGSLTRVESQLNPAGEKEDGACGAAGVPQGRVAQDQP